MSSSLPISRVPWDNLAPETKRALAQLTGLTHPYTVQIVGSGRSLSPTHNHALHSLSLTTAEMALGVLRGRYVVPAPTGFGKTSSIIALARAMHELALRDRFGLLVCQQRVESLCELKQAIVRTGVPEDLIGLVHAKDPDAPEPSIRPEEACHRPIVLWTHARFLSERPLEQLPTYGASPGW